jgi:Uma2 family endonuclease
LPDVRQNRSQRVSPITEINAATLVPQSGDIIYPTSDGRPMGETDLHRSIMVETIDALKLYYAGQQVYVSGNILLLYQPGNRRRHVSPDVLVVKGLDPHDRENYLLWDEGRPPHVVIEVTSESTREEDLYDKFEIYRDSVRVPEYFQFDPRGEYLQPALQGYRLKARRYEPIKPVSGRLPSRELGLHLEPHDRRLRFWDPATGEWIPTLQESREAMLANWQQAEAERQQAEAERQQAEAERQQAEAERQQAEAARHEMEAKWQVAEAQAEQLREELDRLRGQVGK